jgi:hypothetical protein
VAFAALRGSMSLKIIIQSEAHRVRCQSIISCSRRKATIREFKIEPLGSARRRGQRDLANETGLETSAAHLGIHMSAAWDPNVLDITPMDKIYR